MLKVARKRLPGIQLKQADMMTLDLGKQFDVITCLFSAIGHVQTYDNLRKTIRAFVKHLKPGGVLIIEPFFEPGDYKAGLPGMTTYEDDDTKVARLQVAKRKGNIAIFDFHFLVAQRGKKSHSFRGPSRAGAV